MTDLVTGIGLVLVIEGLLWAAFPRMGRTLLEAVSTTPDQTVRTAGAIAVAAGVLIVWLVRG